MHYPGASSLLDVAYIHTVKRASDATAVLIVRSNRRGSRDIERIGLAQRLRKWRR